MQKRIQLLFRFLKFYFSARTKYKIHSPFVYSLCEQVLDDKRNFYAFGELEWLRSQLKSNQQLLKITDLGAGSQFNNSKEKTIATIAKTALSSPWQCKILFRLVNFFQPKKMLELGTSLGISTLYQTAPQLNSTMITIEGDPQIAAIAQQQFKRLKRHSIDLKVGAFRQMLGQALQDLQQLDYVFIDGHHQKEPTLSYFEECLKHSQEHTLIIFDDIHWSSEMEEAWEKIKSNNQVTLTIDLFFMGLVFFRKEQKEKEHFKVVPTSWKPWQTGFF